MIVMSIKIVKSDLKRRDEFAAEEEK